ncbi:MAG: hypothetical protein K2H89_06510 [Oscillospiraceae bacterium]|nr:hypothetical protein [Oscillospiraceae bacterium]
MNMQVITSLFSLFSGENDTDHFLPILTTACEEVTSILRESADTSETRLCYLVAAVANLRYTEIYGARENALATYAGTIARESDATHQLHFAQQLVKSYQGLCRDLIRDSGAFLFSVKG